MSMEAARAAVALGAAALDAADRIPDNWRTLIDGDTLNIYFGPECVLGQLAPHIDGMPLGVSYVGVGVVVFGSDEAFDRAEVSHGFMTSGEVSHAELITAWREELNREPVTA